MGRGGSTAEGVGRGGGGDLREAQAVPQKGWCRELQHILAAQEGPQIIKRQGAEDARQPGYVSRCAVC